MLNVVNAAAQIRITESGGYRQGYRDYECISFVNTASKTASTVTFTFYYFDAKKNAVGSDSLTRSGSFEPNVPDLGPFKQIRAIHAIGEHFDLSQYKNCLIFSFPRQGIAFDVVTVKRVTYSDGTAWEAPPDVPAGTATSTPPSRF